MTKTCPLHVSVVMHLEHPGVYGFLCCLKRSLDTVLIKTAHLLSTYLVASSALNASCVLT